MDSQVKKVIAQYVKLMEVVVKSDGKISYEPAWPEIPDSVQIKDTGYGWIIYD